METHNWFGYTNKCSGGTKVKKLFYFLTLTILLTVLVACKTPNVENPVFLAAPTATTGEAVGSITINAAVDGETGVIYYVVVPRNAVAPNAAQIVAGTNYGSVTVSNSGNSGSAQNITNRVINLTAGTEYTVYFVIVQGELFSDVQFAHVTAKAEDIVPPTLGFSSIALSTGDEDGELKVNITKSGTVGTIYFILVAEGATAPTAQQIVSGTNYGSVTVLKAANAAVFSNYVIDGLTPGTRYTMHTVVTHEGQFSILRNMTATAKETIIVVDKGSGTEADPFQISTIQDLEQVGQGYYILDEKEWNMDSYYVLLNDIDLSEKYGPDKLNWPVLGADAAGARFAGVLDGQGYKISNLYIGQSSTAGVYRGLFASSEPTALVKNLIIENAYVRGAGIDESNANHGTGTLFGYFKGTVRNVQIINATVFDTGTRVGGLAGRSYESGHVYDTYISASVQGYNRVGGFVGVVDVADATQNPIIYQNVVFEGEVIGEHQHIGGIVGYLRGVNMSNVFVKGYIQGALDTGGVAGFFQKRAGNNNVSAFIENAVVYVTVFGTSSSITLGNVVGQVSTSNITLENQGMLVVRNTYHIEGSQTFGGGDVKSVLGTLVSKTDIVDETWLETNLEDWNFETSWEIKSGAERPSLIQTVDLGLLGELSTPLVLLPAITSGPDEKEITVKISANKPNTTIYYVVVASNETALTAEQIKTPTDVLFSGQGETINQMHVMAAYGTTYYVYYYAEHADGNSLVLVSSVQSKAMTELVVTGGLRPGEASKEIIVTLTSNLEATIYYIVVAFEGTYTKEQIKTPTDVLFSGSGLVIDASHIMPLEETTYYIYAYAEMPDRDSVIFTASGLSSSDTYVNYGTGTLADPFIIRTVSDLEKIGAGSYTNEADVILNYTNTSYYKLNNDIDLTDKYGEGKLNWTPLPEFRGHLDGDGFSIIGLYIHAPASTGHNGLFTYINSGATVKHLVLDTVYIHVLGQQSDGTGGMTGSLAGRVNSSSVEHVTVIHATIITEGYRVGGLMGGHEGATGHVKHVYVEADVTGIGRVGGIVGNIAAHSTSTGPNDFHNIVFIGTVSGIKSDIDNRVGGIAGWARGASIKNVYVEGTIGIGTRTLSGGVAGYMENETADKNYAVIENALIHAVIISNGGRAGGLVGSLNSTAARHPQIVQSFQTPQTTLIINATQSSTVIHATVVTDPINQAWFDTTLTGWTTQNGWTWITNANRPSLLNTPDLGLINELDVPLIITESITTGLEEGEVVVTISTNQPSAIIHYAIALDGTFTASEIINATEGEIFESVGSGVSINQHKVLSQMGTGYKVYYVIVDGAEISEVFAKSVTSGAEKPLLVNFSAVTGETNPGDITLGFGNLSHPATVYVYVLLATQDAPDALTIKSLGEILLEETTMNLVPGEAYKAYFYAEKLTGTLHTAVISIEVTAKASPEAPFELTTATLQASESSEELILTLQASHDASLKYIIQTSELTAPTQEELQTTGILVTESPVIITGLLAGTEYKVFILAEKLESTDYVIEELTQTTKRALFNGENTSSYFPIYTLDDLEAYRDGHNLSTYSNTATIEFKADIDFSETYGPTGKNWFPIGTNARKFRGTVQGNNHIINGLYINLSVTTTDMNEGTGLFGTTDNGFSITNLHFTNVNVTGNISVGVVAGYTKVVLLSNVSVESGTVTALNQADSRVGGIFGRFNANSATDSIFEKAYVNVDIYGHKHVGGVIGHVDYSTDGVAGEIIIRDVYALGTVNSPLLSAPNVGGIVGYNRGSIIRAIAYNTINNTETPASQTAAIAGYVQRRHATSVEAKVVDSIGYTNILKIVGSTSTANGTILIQNNLLVVESDPGSGQITLAQLLDVNNWGTLIPLSETTWMVENSKVILK